MKTPCFLLGFLAACSTTPTPSNAVATEALSATDCADPTAFGAIPDDGIDDGPAFRAMYASPGVMHGCVGPGHWTLNYFRFASITLGPGQTLTGAGPSTVFDMTGDGHAGTWFGIQLNGGSVRRIAMNQVGITNPDPGGQVHMIEVGAGDSTVVSDLTLGPSSGGLGDCVRLLGTDSSHQITRAQISNVTALQCGRSGIALQHDVASATVTGSVWNSLGDQDIDYEPTSPGPVTMTITGNIMLHTNHAVSVTLSDAGAGNETVFSNNLVIAGNVQAVRANNVTFSNNTILGDPTAGSETVDFIRNSTGVRVTGNYIVRPATAPAGHVIRFSQNNGGFPTNEIIANNRLVQNTLAPAIHLEGVSRTIVSSNNVTMTAPWSVGYAISCASIGTACDQNAFESNMVESPAGTTLAAIALLGFSGGPIPTGRNLVIGNIGSGFTNSVFCTGPFAGPVRIDNNMLGGTVNCAGASIGTNL